MAKRVDWRPPQVVEVLLRSPPHSVESSANVEAQNALLPV